MQIRNNGYTLKNCRFIVNYDKILENVNIVIQNGYIKNVGREVEGDEVDCSEYIAIPGLVNAHTHTPMIILRGYYDDAELTEWLKKIWEFEKVFKLNEMNIASELAIMEMLSKGTTAFIDMYFNPEGVKEIAEKYGIRAYAGYTFLNSLFEPHEIDKKQRQLKTSELFKPIVNVHSIYSTSIETLKLAKQIAEETDTWIHIHVSETRSEIYEIKKKYGKFPVELLNELGIVKNAQLVHLGWIANWELRYVNQATHCPTSNMKLATAGFFPFKELMENGVNITIGTDGAASNNSLDMFREMKNAVLLQRHSYWDVGVKAFHAFRAATENGYKLINLKGGRIEEGYIADIVLLKKDKLYPLRKDRILSNIVYYTVGEYVGKVIVNGRIVYDEKVEREFDKRRRELLKLLDEIIS
ncbi:amidohydrolase [Saccharolobus solfataricus]|uniref:Amidohydrolase n=3 Tax=Saccharolobus solfataricus TaxID=2287 RepID=Q9UX68_SACSO|nr:amidohydrolase [Saccharolobus solfataricus]AAK40981.1 N-ethylammeline chlorohydrolase, putative (trzA) [Saccharolobus solfataricus P2]AKA74010.1 amidohydrolase [Saccharolobus solfataricus]AKA76707.1 amidohydrolase [Saccharolobus solfataricus]AKA79401.1 amidohydrolase [Saccharolobus solfataricus]AZF68488.1 amidohydrolase [Saccharolobus solfataricus]